MGYPNISDGVRLRFTHNLLGMLSAAERVGAAETVQFWQSKLQEQKNAEQLKAEEESIHKLEKGILDLLLEGACVDVIDDRIQEWVGRHKAIRTVYGALEGVSFILEPDGVLQEAGICVAAQRGFDHIVEYALAEGRRSGQEAIDEALRRCSTQHLHCLQILADATVSREVILHKIQRCMSTSKIKATDSPGIQPVLGAVKILFTRFQSPGLLNSPDLESGDKSLPKAVLDELQYIV